jgi:hypothetical protein
MRSNRLIRRVEIGGRLKWGCFDAFGGAGRSDTGRQEDYIVSRDAPSLKEG